MDGSLGICSGDHTAPGQWVDERYVRLPVICYAGAYQNRKENPGVRLAIVSLFFTTLRFADVAIPAGFKQTN
jgi:hypothetical protein